MTYFSVPNNPTTPLCSVSPFVVELWSVCPCNRQFSPRPTVFRFYPNKSKRLVSTKTVKLLLFSPESGLFFRVLKSLNRGRSAAAICCARADGVLVLARVRTNESIYQGKSKGCSFRTCPLGKCTINAWTRFKIKNRKILVHDLYFSKDLEADPEEQGINVIFLILLYIFPTFMVLSVRPLYSATWQHAFCM